MDPDLTLEKAKKAVRQKEAMKEQHLQLQGEGTKKDPIVLEEVKGRQQPPKRGEARCTRESLRAQHGCETAM